jgi:CMP/dCMP kinase
MNHLNSNRLIIAVDGETAAGKGTLSKLIAKNLGITYFGVGTIFRTVGYCHCVNKVSSVDEAILLIREGVIKLSWDGRKEHVFVEGEEVTESLALSDIANKTAEIASRRENMELINSVIRANGETEPQFICDERNTATIFTNPTHKFYVTAEPKTRALRRFKDLKQQGEDITLEQAYNDLLARDKKDREREYMPLTIPEGATIIDTTDLSTEQALKAMLSEIKPEINEQSELKYQSKIQ